MLPTAPIQVPGLEEVICVCIPDLGRSSRLRHCRLLWSLFLFAIGLMVSLVFRDYEEMRLFDFFRMGVEILFMTLFFGFLSGFMRKQQDRFLKAVLSELGGLIGNPSYQPIKVTVMAANFKQRFDFYMYGSCLRNAYCEHGSKYKVMYNAALNERFVAFLFKQPAKSRPRRLFYVVIPESSYSWIQTFRTG